MFSIWKFITFFWYFSVLIYFFVWRCFVVSFFKWYGTVNTMNDLFFLFNNVKHVICTAESKKKFLESLLLLLEQDRLKYEILCRSQQIGQTLYRRHLQIKVCFKTEVFWHHYHRQLIISHYRIISSAAHVPIFFLCKTRKHRIKGKMKDCIK